MTQTVAIAPEIDDPDRRYSGVLRATRAEGQNLQRLLEDIDLTGQIAEPGAREAALRLALREAEPVFEFNRGQIAQLLAAASDIMNNDPRMFGSHGDELVHIANAWERVCQVWPRPVAATDALDEPDIRRRAVLAGRWLDELAWHVALVTVPGRPQEHLQQLRVGAALNFHETFEDEVRNADTRKKLLRFISTHPAAVDGIVDVEHGVIYRASRTVRRRLLSYLLVLGTALLGFALAYGLSHVGSAFQLTDWPIGPDRTGELLAGYLFLLLGAFVHIAVGALKQARTSEGSSFLAVENLLLWVHVKESSIVAGILSLWVGLVGLTFSLDQVPWQTAFFVGYSIDSVVDLFLQRFAQSASTSAEALTKMVR